MANKISHEHNGLKVNAGIIDESDILEVRAFPSGMLTQLDARPSEAIEYSNRYIRALAKNLGEGVVMSETTDAVHGSAILTAPGKTMQDFEAAHAQAVATIDEPPEYPRGGFRGRMAPSERGSRGGRA